MIRRLVNALLTLTLLGILPCTGFAESGSWTASFDADLGQIHDIAAAGGVAYAATFNGVFRSDDGQSWKEAGLQGRFIWSVVMDTAGETVYAVEPSGALWVSLDAGVHWKGSFPGVGVSALAADPHKPNTVWASSWEDTALRVSEDRGAHWARLETNSGQYGFPLLAFNSIDGTMYAQAFDQSFYTSSNGTEWQNVGFPAATISSIVASASSPGVLYAATTLGLCVYSDRWSCSGQFGTGGELVELPAEGSRPPRLLWAAGSLRVSDDGGDSWQSVSGAVPNSASIRSLGVDLSRGRVFAGGENFALRSDDRGVSWQAAASGLRAAWIEALAQGPDSLFAASGTSLGGLFHRADGDESWSFETLSASTVTIRALAVDATGSTAYAGGSFVLFRKSPGTGWERTAASVSVNAVAIDPADSRSVWLGTDGGVTHSADGGQTWSSVQVAQDVYALIADPRRPSRVYAGSYERYECPFGCYPYGGALFTSDDSGATWRKSQDLGSTVVELALDPFDANSLYAGTVTGGILSSGDGGDTWRSPSSNPPGELTGLVADPTRPDTLYASTTQGVHRSRDRGRSWLPLAGGLGVPHVRSIAISADGRFLHAGTAGAGTFDLALSDEPLPTFPCVPGPSRLCLLGNRFQVELIAQRKGGGGSELGVAHPLGDRAGYFGIASFTGDPTLPEVAVKLLPNGVFGVDGFPVFYSSMTGGSFVLRVTDTVEALESVYRSDSARPFCGGHDLVALESSVGETKSLQSQAAAAQTLSLLGGRFTVSVEARSRSGKTSSGVAFASGDRYGIFSLPGITGDARLPELVVKMLDGRGFNDAFWVFRGSLTSLQYTLTVRDEQTGETRTYENGESFCGGADILAFIE